MTEFFNRNSPSAVIKWAFAALDKSKLTKEERQELGDVALRCAAKGLWRGDVCERWREMGYGSDKIEDFYP